MPKTNVIFICLAVLLGPLVLAGKIEVGDTYEKVIAELGQPGGVVDVGGKTCLSYPGGVIKVKDGRVVYVDPEYENKTRGIERRQQYENKQKSKGLVFYEGNWILPEEKTALEQKKAADYQFQQQIKAKKETAKLRIKDYKNNGAEINMTKILQSRYINIVVFYQGEHPDTKNILSIFDTVVADDPELFLSKIDFVNGKSPLAKQYDLINYKARAHVFDRKGALVGGPVKDTKNLLEFIEEAKKK